MTIFCESERLYLRSIDLSDSKLITKWKNDPLIKEMSVGSTSDINLENQRDDIKKSLYYNQPYLMIIVKSTNRPIGYVRIDWLDDENLFAWLRFGLGAERGKGYSKEALKSMITKLFENGLHRIDAEVYDFNIISANLLKSIGFNHEGTRRKAYYSNNKFSDIFVFGLLKEDFITNTKNS